jgi:hypothetical protein
MAVVRAIPFLLIAAAAQAADVDLATLQTEIADLQRRVAALEGGRPLAYPAALANAGFDDWHLDWSPGFAPLDLSPDGGGQHQLYWNLWYKSGVPVPAQFATEGGVLHTEWQGSDIDICSMSHDGNAGRWWTPPAYVEVRFRFDSGQPSAFAAYWLMSRAHAKSADGGHWSEIDGFESYDGNTGRLDGVATTTLWDHAVGGRDAIINSQGNTRTGLPYVYSAYHTFGTLWEKDLVHWFIDDQEVNRSTTHDINGEAHFLCIVSNQSHAGLPGATIDEQFAHVWQP